MNQIKMYINGLKSLKTGLSPVVQPDWFGYFKSSWQPEGTFNKTHKLNTVVSFLIFLATGSKVNKQNATDGRNFPQ